MGNSELHKNCENNCFEQNFAHENQIRLTILQILQINISVDGKNELSGLQPNKKLNAVLQINFMWLYI